MKIETQRQENCTLTFTVEVENERVQPALRAAAKRLGQQYRIPGFRPGKAPYETIVRHFGEEALYREALDTLGQKIYEEALAQEKIEPYAPGALEDIQLKPMVLKFTVLLPPEIDLGDYRALRVPYTPPAITDDALNEALEHLREHHAVLDPVDRPAALGDVVALDANAFLNEGENPSDFLLADKDVALLLDEKADWPMPGFALAVVGMKAGETKKFDLTFPEDYANASLRGQTAHLEVTCKEVKSRSLPEWSDELAQEVGEYESLDDLRAKVRASLQQQADRTFEQGYQNQVVEQLVEQTTVKYPPVLLEGELDNLMEELDRRLREQRLTLDDYLKIEGKTKEQLREEYLPQAEKRLKRGLALGKVVELEKLTVSDADVAEEIDRFSSMFGEESDAVRKSFSTDKARSALALDILTNTALKRLVAIAKGEDVPLPPAADTPEDEPENEPENEETNEPEPALAEAATEPAPAAESSA